MFEMTGVYYSIYILSILQFNNETVEPKLQIKHTKTNTYKVVWSNHFPFMVDFYKLEYVRQHILSDA